MSVRIALASLLSAAFLAGCAAAIRDDTDLEQVVDRIDALRAASDRDANRDPAALRVAAERDWATRNPTRVAAAVAAWVDAAAQSARGIEDLSNASEAAAWLGDRTEARVQQLPGETRAKWAAVAVDTAVLCRERSRDDPRCAYRLAIALGVQARERRATGLDALPKMVELLESVLEADPELDRSGARRVLAWVHLRAPAWPTGPGDPELALEYAEEAVSRAPDSAPNRLVLAAVLAELGERGPAIEAYEAALRLVETVGKDGRDSPDRADWIREAEGGLTALGVLGE